LLHSYRLLAGLIHSVVAAAAATCIVSGLAALGCGSSDKGSNTQNQTCTPASPYTGDYRGTWGQSGSERFAWTATVDACGAVSGTGENAYSCYWQGQTTGCVQTTNGTFKLSGTVTSKGEMTFDVVYSDAANHSAEFRGEATTSKAVSGSWSTANGLGYGSFRGEAIAGSDAGKTDQKGLVCQGGKFYLDGVEFKDCFQCAEPSTCSFEVDSFNNPYIAHCAGQTASCADAG
jgi:hypothetical protein